MSVKKKRTIGPCRGVTWLYYVVFLWLRDFFPPLYLDPRFRPLLLKYNYLNIVYKFTFKLFYLKNLFRISMRRRSSNPQTPHPIWKEICPYKSSV